MGADVAADSIAYGLPAGTRYFIIMSAIVYRVSSCWKFRESIISLLRLYHLQCGYTENSIAQILAWNHSADRHRASTAITIVVSVIHDHLAETETNAKRAQVDALTTTSDGKCKSLVN